MKLRFPTIVIFVTAAAWAGFAAWLGCYPDALLPAFGIEDSTPMMLTEVRAFYGGVELAIAASVLILWRRGDLFAALLIGGLPLAGSATGRCIGLFLDGYSSIHAGFAVLEIVGAAMCFVGCLLTLRTNTDG